jgi:prevent-host-death family protein
MRAACATLCYMSIVGVRELRQNLSVYLERVKRGEALTVTERGHVVALLRPPDRADTLVDRLVSEGRARPARRAPSALPKPLRVRLRSPLGQILDEQRSERA